MQLRLHNPSGVVVDHLNNGVPGSLKYKNDTFMMYMGKLGHTLSLSIDKWSNGSINPRIQYIESGGYISFVYMGEYHCLRIVEVVEDDYQIDIDCVSSVLEVTSEINLAFENKETEYTLEDYTNILQLFTRTNMELGINEVSNRKRIISFDDGNIGERLLTLASEFGAELKIETQSYPNGDFKKYVAHFYEAPSRNNPDAGIGRNRKDIQLMVGRDIDGVSISSNSEDMFNAIRIRDKEGKYFKSDKDRVIKTADGRKTEIYVNRNSNTIYAPISMTMYPSTLKKNACDNWTVRDIKTDLESEEAMYLFGVEMLERYMYPVRVYTIDIGRFDNLQKNQVCLGDTIYASDDRYLNGLLFSARVVSMRISFTNNTGNSIEISNTARISSQIPDALTSMYNEMKKAAQPYSLSVSTTNGVTFKTDISSTTITPKLYKGLDLLTGPDVTFEYYRNDIYFNEGGSLTVSAGQVTGEVMTLDVVALHANIEVARIQLTLTRVSDGTSPILTVVKSSNGTIFQNGRVDTTMTASLWRNDREIDIEGTSFNYNWFKTDAQGRPDPDWNARYNGASHKNITITGDDVSRKAVFTCEVTPA